MDIQSIINKCKAEKLPEDIIDYVFNQSKVLTSEFFFEYEKMLTIMFDGGLDITDNYFINLCKIAVAKNGIFDIFYALRNQKIDINIKIDFLLKAGMSKSDAVLSVFDNEYIYNRELFQDNFDILLTDYEKDFFSYYYLSVNTEICKGITNKLLEKDYNKYIDVVKSKLINVSSCYTNESYVLNLINDDIFIENYFIAKLILLIKKKADPLTIPDTERCLVNYLKTGGFEKDFDVVLNNFLKRFGKNDSVFYGGFLAQYNLDLTKQFHKNLLNLSIKLEFESTLNNIVKINTESNDENIEYLKKYIKDYDLEKPILFKYLTETSMKSYYGKAIEQQIEYLIENYYDDCVKGFKLISKKTFAKNYNKFDEYKKLLDSKK